MMGDITYAYEPLPSNTEYIRLMHLHPGLMESDEVACDIFVYSCVDLMPYEALSYAWYEPTTHRMKSTTLDGAASVFVVGSHGDGNKPESWKISIGSRNLSVTPNLHSALRHLRHEDKVRVLWVDAACINQDDNDERSAQVELIGHIYSRASRTVVWLGEGFEGNADVFDFFRACAKSGAGKDEAELHTYIPITQMDPVLFDGEVIDQIPARLAPSLREFFDRKWFYRKWVIQEVVLANDVTVMCGKLSCPWEILVHSAKAFHLPCFTNPEIVPSMDLAARNIIVIMLLAQKPQATTEIASNISDWALWTMSFKSTEPRDAIFALNGLIPREQLGPIRVDYSQPWEILYIQTSSMKLIQGGDLSESLKFATCGEVSKVTSLPSWSIDWQNLEFEKWASHAVRDLRAAAGTNLKASWEIFKHCKILSVKGVIFDTVKVQTTKKLEPLRETSLTREDDSERASTLEKHSDFLNECDGISTKSNPYPSGEDFNTCYSTTMISDAVPNASHDQLAKGYIDMRTSYQKRDYDYMDEKSQEYWRYFILANQRRKFFVSNGNYLGWVPPETEPGDVICVFYGVDVPFVLRPQDSGTFKLIGDCYCHGIMKGEALRMEHLKHEDILIS